MRIDLSNPFNEATNNLKNWRNRYSKHEYPFKVVLNIFYRQYTMNSIWENQIENSFSRFKNTETDVLAAFQKLEEEYSNASGQFTIGNTLIDLMNKQQDVGGLNYKTNIPIITRAQNGDNKAIEELEFTYVYYMLCNKATLMWAAFGRKGFSKIDAIAQVTGVVIEYSKPIGYADILSVLGRLGIAPLMQTMYSPMPNFHLENLKQSSDLGTHYIILHLSENKDQNSGVTHLLAEMTESKNMPLVMQTLNEGKKPEGDIFVFKLGTPIAKMIISSANNNELVELDTNDFRTQQNFGSDGKKMLSVHKDIFQGKQTNSGSDQYVFISFDFALNLSTFEDIAKLPKYMKCQNSSTFDLIKLLLLQTGTAAKLDLDQLKIVKE